MQTPVPAVLKLPLYISNFLISCCSFSLNISCGPLLASNVFMSSPLLCLYLVLCYNLIPDHESQQDNSTGHL